MSVITTMRRQSAVYWKKTGMDRYGVAIFDAPVEVECRWDDKLGQTLDAKGELESSIAKVYVDREMFIGDKLKKGEMDSDTADSPMEDREAFEIQGFEQNPDFRNREILYTAHL